MKIPRKIRVLGHDYSVEVTKDAMYENGALGLCCNNTQRISISDGIKDDAKMSCLIHEVLEAVKFQLNLGSADGDEDAFPHHILSQISTAIFCVVRDNKWL